MFTGGSFWPCCTCFFRLFPIEFLHHCKLDEFHEQQHATVSDARETVRRGPMMDGNDNSIKSNQYVNRRRVRHVCSKGQCTW